MEKKIVEGAITYGEKWDSEGNKVFFMDHQCDEWEIGNLEDAKKFYEDLGKLIKTVEGGM